jgi:hypothetical protein
VPMQFRLERFRFPAEAGSVKELSRTLEFDSPVTTALATVSGFEIGFLAADHELGRMTVTAQVTLVSAQRVTVAVRFGLRDNSGNFDDSYSGWVDVGIVAERV